MTGTINYAAHLTISTAIDFHNRLGPEKKRGHLQRLRDYWVDRVKNVAGLEILQPANPRHYGSVAAFRLPSAPTWDGAKALQQRFIDEHRLMIDAKRGLASGPAMRVTPALFDTTQELDRLIAAIRSA